MSYEINEVVIIDENRNIVNAGVGTYTKLVSSLLEVGSSAVEINNILDEDNLASDSATALPTQQSVKAYVDAAFTAVQSDVNGNESDSDSADAALSGRLDTLEADPTTQSALSFEAVTRNDADNVLSGRLDTLEADPTTATALAAVQADVDANELAMLSADASEASARQSADNTLSSRLDTLEADPTTATALAAVQADVDANEASITAALGTVIGIQATVVSEVGTNTANIDDLATLSGVAIGSTTLGTFSGSTISDASTIKAALQDLENGVDNALGGGAAATSIETVALSTNAAHYLTFVNANNVSGTQESVFTDAGIQYNPSSNLLTVGEIVVAGDLTVNGSQTIINTTTITTEDKNITLGNTSAPTESSADGGGFTLKGATDKTFNWIASTGSFTASEHIDLASGKQFLINNVGVLNATTLGAGVVNSSLTSVGDLTDLTVDGVTTLKSAVFLGDSSIDAIAVVGGIASDLEPLVTNSVDLGVSARKWKDLYLDGIVSIDDTNVLSVDTLGAGVLNSSLTSVGSLTALTVTGDITANGNLVGDGSSNISGISSITASGKVFAQAFSLLSDENLKENIEEIEGAIEKVEAIRGVTFDWKDGSGSTAGIIAQEVEAVMPMLIESGEFKRVDYNGLVGLLVEAVKELSTEVKELKANN